MFQSKINIYKVIKMLAKIKHDEDIFKRPLDPNSNWYKLSRNKMDYRQIIFDRMNRYRPGLADYIKMNPPVWQGAPVPSDNRISPFKLARGLSESSKYFNGYYQLESLERYRKFPEGNDYHKDANSFTGYFEDDAFYASRYDVYNYWWFDLCLIPETESLLTRDGRNSSTTYILGDINAVDTEDNVGLRKYYKYSPSRDLATSVMIQFASMQKNPRLFLHKMSYVTAPYMPYVEQEKKLTSPFSKTTYALNNPDDNKGITASIYGLGSLEELFISKTSKTMIDRLKRQKMFNDFFVALDSKDWLAADKISDELIKITDAMGWAPYIGYGDLSLFIQRMNIPSEYIMTHGLTNFQDQVLTAAFAANQINNRIMDTAYMIQKSDGRDDLLHTDPTIIVGDEEEIMILQNPLFEEIRDTYIDTQVKLRQAVSNHIMTGGTIDEAEKIIQNSSSPSEMIDELNHRLVLSFIENEISSAKKL